MDKINQAQTMDGVYVSFKNLNDFKTLYDSLTDEKLNTLIGRESRLFKSFKNNFELNDSEIIKEYFKNDIRVSPRQGDVFVIETIIDEVSYEYSSYIFLNKQWEAITGNIDADKVIFKKDFIGAGNWEQFGTIKKGLNETVIIPAKGKSAQSLFASIVSERIQPKITSKPAVSGFTLEDAKPVEAGTKLNQVTFGTAILNKGSYTYGPDDTGVSVISYKIDRICIPSTYNLSNISSEASGTDSNNGLGFVIGDIDGENVVQSLKYRVFITHTDGIVAKDSLGDNSNPEIKITSGTKSRETNAYIPFRSYFYGSSIEKKEINSEYIRSLTNSNEPYSSKTITINVPAGSQRITFACLATLPGITRVINESALNADITNVFLQTAVDVEGANGYAGKDYTVWYYEPAQAFSQDAILKITLG